MKKRWLWLAVAVCMALLPALHGGAQAESVLMEKIQKQIHAGSGLQGSVTATGIGGLENLVLDVKYLKQKEQGQTQLSLANNGAELLKAALYSQDGITAVDMGLVSGKLIGFSGGLEALAAGLVLDGATGTGTPAYSAIYDILFPQDEKEAARLAEAAAPYVTKAELWMQGFAQGPVLEKDEDGVSVMTVTYKISAAALKAQIKQLLIDLLADETLLPMLWEYVAPEQANLYLNPALQSFYFQALDALPLAGEIAMTRRVSTMGKHLETTVFLPLSGASGGLTSLLYSDTAVEGGDLIEVTAVSDNGTLQVAALKAETQRENAFSYTGTLRYLPAEEPNWQVDSTVPKYTGKALSVSYQAEYEQKIFVDEEEKNQESHVLSLTTHPDWSHLAADVTEEIRSQYILTEPAVITASLLLKSGQARNASTAVEIAVGFASGETDIKIAGQFKTAPPWNVEPVDMAAALRLEDMAQAEQDALLVEVLGKPGILQLLSLLIPADQEIPGTVG